MEPLTEPPDGARCRPDTDPAARRPPPPTTSVGHREARRRPHGRSSGSASSSRALVIALLIKTFLFQAFYIPSESMVPTLEDARPGARQQALVQAAPVHRGDIVVFKAPPNGTDPDGQGSREARHRAARRDRRRHATATCTINGKELNEPYLPGRHDHDCASFVDCVKVGRPRTSTG